MSGVHAGQRDVWCLKMHMPFVLESWVDDEPTSAIEVRWPRFRSDIEGYSQ